ncbi:N-acetylmuramoyl-L-alanine amidase [Nonomuraea spiralis]|uniref:N-acetylmuramoyl-L-alanine amidase n=1 Tax=Nonomuraea TaxID=83681 RepID=UPI000F79957F|nr:N-acetylmuramoyl-L-alanine amidase [Nonomuraea sp. WAC 01424]RSN07417.1 N-acetylmuramoyl-L-alanine amidase [Nonomuraea sp. WAC 01424]
MGIVIVDRAGWNARPPRDPADVEHVPLSERTEFVVHHTETPADRTPRSIQDSHMDERGWNDIGYNFLVRDDGTVYEGRGWLVRGAHATDHNVTGIGCAYIGMNQPTETAKRTIRALYDEACAKTGHELAKRGHSDVGNTDCPGTTLLAWVTAGMQVAEDLV